MRLNWWALLLLLCTVASLQAGADAPWSQQPTVLLGLGDSMTAGFGASRGHDYFSLLSAEMHRHLPNLLAAQKAESGSTSDEHLDTIEHLAPYGREYRGIVVITTGGNDIIHNYGRSAPRELAMYGATVEQARPWIKDFGDRLEAMHQTLQTRFPGGCQIFLANIYDPTDGQGDIENAGLPRWPEAVAVLASYNDRLARLAQAHRDTHLVDLHALFLGHGIHGTMLPMALRPADPNYWYYVNLEDPNDRGYQAIYQAFWREIEQTR